MKNISTLINLLACPMCKEALKLDNDKETSLFCGLCNYHYEIKNGVPILLDHETKKEMDSSLDKYRRIFNIENPFLSGLKKWILPFPFRFYEDLGNLSREKNIHGPLKRFLEKHDDKQVIIDIGSGNRQIDSKFINFDIDTFFNVDTVGSAEFLPFVSNSVDVLIVQQVLPHLKNLDLAMSEIKRVLKKDGEVYVEVAHMCPYDGAPDYHRFTLSGLDLLFSDFKKLENGPAAGGGSAFATLLWHFLMTYFLIEIKGIKQLQILLFTWFASVFKYIDKFSKRENLKFPLTIYYIGVNT